MKACAGCGQVFPLETYGVKLSNADGTVRQYKPRCAICRAEEGAAQRARMAWRRQHGAPVDAEHVPRLSLAPWRAWLLQALAQEDGQASLANRLDVDQRRLYTWLHDGSYVCLDTVDRALCAYGSPGALRDIYPHLFEFDEEQGFDDDEQEELAA